MEHEEIEKAHENLNALEKSILSSRWLLIPFYYGLYIVMAVYLFFYAKEVFHIVMNAPNFNKNEIVIAMLEMIDIVMIANLTKMIMVGSYNSFVIKFPKSINENVSSGMLKIKMSTSLIGVSSIHLLQDFINAQHLTWDVLSKMLGIHGAFIVGAIALAYIEKITHH